MHNYNRIVPIIKEFKHSKVSFCATMVGKLFRNTDNFYNITYIYRGYIMSGFVYDFYS